MYLSATEINIMRRDFEQLLASPEATLVTLRYHSPQTTSTSFDTVYKKPIQTLAANPTNANARCIHDVLDVEKLKKYPGGFMKEGESVFYFSTLLNLKEPAVGFPVAFDSLLIIDALSQPWKPKLIDGGLAAFHHLFRVGQYQIAQAVACVPQK